MLLSLLFLLLVKHVYNPVFTYLSVPIFPLIVHPRSRHTGMHKKSIEAAEKLKEDDIPDLKKDSSPSKGKEVLRSESIATLRAKAQQHSAKVMEALGATSGSGQPLPNHNNNNNNGNGKTYICVSTAAPSLSSHLDHSSLTSSCSLGLDLDCFGDPS